MLVFSWLQALNVNVCVTGMRWMGCKSNEDDGGNKCRKHKSCCDDLCHDNQVVVVVSLIALGANLIVK